MNLHQSSDIFAFREQQKDSKPQGDGDQTKADKRRHIVGSQASISPKDWQIVRREIPLGNLSVAESTQNSLKPAATININFSKVAEDQTILHTAVTRCKEQPVTVLFDCGSNGTMITKAAADRLNLRARNASKNLQLETIQGESQITTKEVVVPLRETSPSKRHHPKVISKTEPDVVNLNCFILDTFMEIQSDRTKPNLKKRLARIIWRNF